LFNFYKGEMFMSLQSVEDFVKNAATTIEGRISSITSDIEKSAQFLTNGTAQHNALLGALNEAKTILDALNAMHLPGIAGTVIGALDSAAGAATGAVNTATNVVSDVASV
jgi:ABC-type transporter Mla subunit MlaD